MTVAAAFRSGVAELAGAPTDTPALEAAVLLADALGVSKERLFARMGDPVGARGMASFRRALDLRRNAVPVAYIRGVKEFYGHTFSVDRRVLIPRPDTECLVEAALAAVAEDPSVRRVHDVGTGSGCIAIALKAARPELAVSVSDVDAACLEVCRVNQRRLLGRECLHARVADLLAGVPGPLDMIVANPPYLDAAACARMAGRGWQEPMGALRALPDAIGSMNTGAFALGAVALGVASLWPRRFARYLPGLLVALLAGTALGALWLTGAPVIGEIPRGLPSMQLELPTVGFVVRSLQPALILALLGSVDSLLTSLVADSLTGTQHKPNRELVGQGIGNVIAGLFGGLPGAGATMGTVTNIRAGGTTRASGALRALLVLGLLLGLGGYVEPIPHAVLAGILMKVGWDIIDWPLLTRVHRIRREHLFVMALTLGLTVFVDLVTAVAIGFIAAGMVHARQLEGLELDSVVSVPLLDHHFFAGRVNAPAVDRYAARTGLVRLKGSFTVASSRKLYSVVGGDIKDHDVVIFDLSEATYMDDSAAMTIRRLLATAAAEETQCVVTGVSGKVDRTLRALDILRDLPRRHVVETMVEAREIAIGLLEG